MTVVWRPAYLSCQVLSSFRAGHCFRAVLKEVSDEPVYIGNVELSASVQIGLALAREGPKRPEQVGDEHGEVGHIPGVPREADHGLVAREPSRA